MIGKNIEEHDLVRLLAEAADSFRVFGQTKIVLIQGYLTHKKTSKMTKYEALLAADSANEVANNLKEDTFRAYNLALNEYQHEYRAIKNPTPEEKLAYGTAINRFESCCDWNY